MSVAESFGDPATYVETDTSEERGAYTFDLMSFTSICQSYTFVYNPPENVIVYRGGLSISDGGTDGALDSPGSLSDGLVAPDTDSATANGLPIQEADKLTDFVQNPGSSDGVSREAAPSPTANLIGLAAAGRNPADITIPTQGTESSGEDDDDAVVAGGTINSTSGGQATTSTDARSTTSMSSGSTVTTTASTAVLAATSVIDTSELRPDDGGGGGASGSHLTPQPGGYIGGGYNPMNWRRYMMTGDPNAPDEYYQAGDEAAGAYVLPRIAPAVQTVGGVVETTAGATMVASGRPIADTHFSG